MPVHLLGNPVDMERLDGHRAGARPLGDRGHLRVARAHASGARRSARSATSARSASTSRTTSPRSRAGCWSPTTIASPTWRASMRAHGWTRDMSNREELEAANPWIDPRFLFVNLGYNLRPTELQAAFGLVQLERLEEFNERRREQRPLPGGCAVATCRTSSRFVTEQEGGRSTWFGFTVMLPDGDDAAGAEPAPRGAPDRDPADRRRQPRRAAGVPRQPAPDGRAASRTRPRSASAGSSSGTTRTSRSGQLDHIVDAFRTSSPADMTAASARVARAADRLAAQPLPAPDGRHEVHLGGRAPPRRRQPVDGARRARLADYWRERYAEAGVPLREIGGPTSTSMLYWLALPGLPAAGPRRAVDREPRRTPARSCRASSRCTGRRGRRAPARGIRHAHLCFEPFPFFHDREVIGMYPAPKRALLAYLRDRLRRDRHGRASRDADRLLTLNEATAASIERVYGRSDAEPTYAGVDTQFFHPYSDDGAGRPARAPRRRAARDPLDRLLADQAHGPRAARVRGRRRSAERTPPGCS